MEPNDRIEQQRVTMVIDELTADACWSHLAQVPTGRLCFVDGGEPMVLPLNHVVDGHSIVVRTAAGTAPHRLGEGATVAFEADATRPATCEGWSVVLRGHLAEVTDEQELADARPPAAASVGVRAPGSLPAAPAVGGHRPGDPSAGRR